MVCCKGGFVTLYPGLFGLVLVLAVDIPHLYVAISILRDDLEVIVVVIVRCSLIAHTDVSA